MIELVNRICELAAEVGKAQMMFEQQAEKDKQTKTQFEGMSAELDRRQNLIESLQQQVTMFKQQQRPNSEDKVNIVP